MTKLLQIKVTDNDIEQIISNYKNKECNEEMVKCKKS